MRIQVVIIITNDLTIRNYCDIIKSVIKMEVSVLVRKKKTVETTVKEEAPVKKRGRKPAAEKAEEPEKVTATPEEKPVKKATRTRKVKAPDPIPEKAAEPVPAEAPKAAPAPKKTRPKKEKAVSEKAAAPVVAETPKAEPVKEEKPAKKAPARRKAKSKAADKKSVSVELQFASGNYTADEIAEKCKEAYRAGTKKQIRTLEVYVNAAEAKAFYVVNGKSADENGNAYSIDL